MFSVWYEISFAEVILHWGLSLKLPHVASYVSVCFPMFAYSIFGISLPRWITGFSPSWSTFFSKEMQLGKADEMEENPCFSLLPFFFDNVWELPVMSGFCFFNVQCYFGTIFTIYSPLMYYEWILEIVGWWHHFPKNVAETYENQWLSTGQCWVFGQLCIAFWSGEISLPRWLWIHET